MTANPVVTMTRTDLVTLLRLACDTSSEPLTPSEQGFLRDIITTHKITRRDGVVVLTTKGGGP